MRTHYLHLKQLKRNDNSSEDLVLQAVIILPPSPFPLGITHFLFSVSLMNPSGSLMLTGKYMNG